MSSLSTSLSSSSLFSSSPPFPCWHGSNPNALIHTSIHKVSAREILQKSVPRREIHSYLQNESSALESVPIKKYFWRSSNMKNSPFPASAPLDSGFLSFLRILSFFFSFQWQTYSENLSLLSEGQFDQK